MAQPRGRLVLLLVQSQQPGGSGSQTRQWTKLRAVFSLWSCQVQRLALCHTMGRRPRHLSPRCRQLAVPVVLVLGTMRALVLVLVLVLVVVPPQQPAPQ